MIGQQHDHRSGRCQRILMMTARSEEGVPERYVPETQIC